MSTTLLAETPSKSSKFKQAGFWGTLLLVTSLLQSFVYQQVALAQWTALLAVLAFLIPQILTFCSKTNINSRRQVNLLAILAVLSAMVQLDYQVAAFIAGLMLLSLTLEKRSASGARLSVEALMRLRPPSARYLEQGEVVEKLVDQLQINDLIQVRPGDTIAVDGVIVEGFTTVDEAPITGESLPRDKHCNDDVFAGSTNLHGLIVVKVSRIGSETTLGKVQKLIEQAEHHRTPLARLIDQCMNYYTPMILLMAGLVWLTTFDFERVVALLVVACPCALLLATPSASIGALTATARAGLLVKDLSQLETAAHIDTIIFDKTGTLTEGKLAVCHLEPTEKVDAATLTLMAHAAESLSSHPAATAINKLAQEASITLQTPVTGHEVPGLGVEATYQEQTIRVGRASWILPWCEESEETLSATKRNLPGMTQVYVAVNQQLLGWIGLKDQVRSVSKPLIEKLRQTNQLSLAMVTGDNLTVATEVAHQLGIQQVVAECLPEDKVNIVKQFQATGAKVAFVGDGVNDAPALSLADCSFAMGAHGSEVAIHSATVNLTHSHLEKVAFFLHLAQKTRWTIAVNLFIGAILVLVGLYLAASGLLQPTTAAVLNTSSTFLVVINSARLLKESSE